MPVLTQLNLNIGTEQNPNMVLHDLHDIRISSTDVNTVTRLLGCDAGVNSIAPLTLANAASLLGVQDAGEWLNGNLSNIDRQGLSFWHLDKDRMSPAAEDRPFNFGDILHMQSDQRGYVYRVQFGVNHLGDEAYIRRAWNNTSYTSWKRIAFTS